MADYLREHSQPLRHPAITTGFAPLALVHDLGFPTTLTRDHTPETLAVLPPFEFDIWSPRPQEGLAMAGIGPYQEDIWRVMRSATSERMALPWQIVYGAYAYHVHITLHQFINTHQARGHQPMPGRR